MREKLLWSAFVVVAACAVAAVIGLWLRGSEGALRRAPDFQLIERSGRPLSRHDLLGEVWVADFIFTRCRTVCGAMNSAMFELHRDVDGVRFVSFTVDPEHDTPEHLREWVQTNGLAQDSWDFATADTDEQMQEVARGFLLSVDREGNLITHSERFVLMDRYGRIRGTYLVIDPMTLERIPGVMARMEADIRRVVDEPYLPVHRLPAVNASLNGTSFLLLVLGYGLIRTGKKAAHKACMLGALGASTLFFVGYLTAHHYLGATPYPGEGWLRPLYFTILISHTILAAFIVPLVGITLWQAFRGHFDRHKSIARWTLPLWLYVSLTGVVIYFMLYG